MEGNGREKKVVHAGGEMGLEESDLGGGNGAVILKGGEDYSCSEMVLGDEALRKLHQWNYMSHSWS